MSKLILAVSIALIVWECSSKTEKANYPIQFEVIQSQNIPAGGIRLTILVSENETQEDVMALARMLFYENSKKGNIFLQIFDSREVLSNRDNPNYSEREYWKHFLVDASYNSSTGSKDLKWVAENRGR